jgi:hypothetical protein
MRGFGWNVWIEKRVSPLRYAPIEMADDVWRMIFSEV